MKSIAAHGMSPRTSGRGRLPWGIAWALLLACAAARPASAHTYPLTAYGCTVSIPDTGWQVDDNPKDTSSTTDEFREILSAIGDKAVVIVNITEDAAGEATEISSLEIAEIKREVEGAGGTMLGKETVVVNGKTCLVVRAMLPIGEGLLRNAYAMIVPGDEWAYMLMAVAIQEGDDPRNDPDVKAIFDGFRVTSKPAATPKSSGTPLFGGSETSTQYTGIGGLAIIGIIIAARAARNRRKREEAASVRAMAENDQQDPAP